MYWKKWWTMRTNSWLCVYFCGCLLYLLVPVVQMNEKNEKKFEIKKWSIVAGQRINSCSILNLLSALVFASLDGDFSKQSFFFISFFPQTMDSLWPLDLISWSAASKLKCMNKMKRNTHTKPPWTGQQRHGESREKQFYILNCSRVRFFCRYTHTHTYTYMYVRSADYTSRIRMKWDSLFFVLIQKQNSNDIKENWWQIKSTILVAFHKTVNANGLANLDKIIIVRRQILTWYRMRAERNIQRENFENRKSFACLKISRTAVIHLCKLRQ